MPAYTAWQNIREEAGLQHKRRLESVTGLVNGANTVFLVPFTPIVDSTGDNLVTTADVIAYVNDAVVSVSAVNAEAGQVTLAVAPATGATVAMTYYSSSASDSFIASLLSEASSWVDSRIAGVHTLPLVSVPPVITTATRLYAAGLALIRDYGSSGDSDLTSKDGYKKIELAKSLLSDYVGSISDDSTSPASQAIGVKTDGNIFERVTDLDNNWNTVAPDDKFMRRED